MSQVLYRKYRPEKLSEVVGQDHIVKTLQAALKNDRLSHAYLFTGPRGVGKTSVARILAYEANGLKYGDRSAGLDIIEIDGASNRRIEEVRDLRDKVHITPVSGRYKIYIIDEVHMLTKEAFNALLKTLEEPPAHCIFILATTESHKLPETIISRAQRFTFKPITENDIARHLAKVAKTEGIAIDGDSLDLIAKHGQGSFRDSLSLLDQLRPTGDEISVDFVRSYLGLPSNEQIGMILECIKERNLSKLSKVFVGLRDSAANPSLVARAIGESVRAMISSGQSEIWQTILLKDLLDVSSSPLPQERLEIALLEAASSQARSNTASVIAIPTESIAEPPAPKPHTPTKAKKTVIDQELSFSTRDWHSLISKVSQGQPAAALALKHGVAELTDDRFKINFEFSLYKNKLNRTAYKDLIGKILTDEFNIDLPIELVVDKTKFGKNQKPQLQTITNIFGGGEVLESSVKI